MKKLWNKIGENLYKNEVKELILSKILAPAQ